MAKCAICEKTASHGNKLSITRSQVKDHQELGNQI